MGKHTRDTLPDGERCKAFGPQGRSCSKPLDHPEQKHASKDLAWTHAWPTAFTVIDGERDTTPKLCSKGLDGQCKLPAGHEQKRHSYLRGAK